ncbi:MAG: PTS sugar transporter subunit IIA [Candidatus Eisenbacteria sp.]|nr:PTS sugar transporter subunit IIA [Candidatus Eisenbacteria bacterium]
MRVLFGSDRVPGAAERLRPGGRIRGLEGTAMQLADLLNARCVLLGMPPLSKEELIRSMVDRLAEAGLVESVAPVVRALLDRERVMSTGVGGGVALPHAQCTAVMDFAVAFARPSEPVEFEALDGEPVQVLFMVVGPGDRTGLMRILTRISRLLYTGDLQKKALKVQTPEEFIRLVAAEEARIKA